MAIGSGIRGFIDKLYGGVGSREREQPKKILLHGATLLILESSDANKEEGKVVLR
jgi:hypothetical protein